MTTADWIAIVVIATSAFFWGGLWAWAEIEHWVRKRRRGRMR